MEYAITSFKFGQSLTEVVFIPLYFIRTCGHKFIIIEILKHSRSQYQAGMVAFNEHRHYSGPHNDINTIQIKYEQLIKYEL